MVDKLVFRVRDKDLIGSESLGRIEIRAADLRQGKKRVSGWMGLQKEGGNGWVTGARLNVSVKFYSVTEVTANRDVPRCYFAPTPDNRVTLFQDAFTPENPLYDTIKLADNRPYQPHSAWKTVSKMLNEAKIFIYMAGWSINSDTTLLRDDSADEESVGKLLERKANEGVRVLLLIWDDRSSTDLLEGLGTHDNKTQMFFHGSKVCLNIDFRLVQQRYAWCLKRVHAILSMKSIQIIST